MIKLLALDLDGSLLDSRGGIPEQNRTAIRNAEQAGVLVTIATGRRFRDARPAGVALQLNAPLITHNGALLKYADSLETVHVDLLSTPTAIEIIRVGRNYGGDALVSADPREKGILLYDRVSEKNEPLQRYLRWAETLHGSEAAQAIAHVQDLEREIRHHDVIHISFSGSCTAMYDMERYLETELGGTVTLLSTVYPLRDFTLIDILPPDASKGSGLEKLAAKFGVDREHVMAIGDNFNDIEMLEFAGTPVVMGNADPSLIEREEFYTTVSNDECGVSAAIEKFIFQRESE
jgi:HAD superfamily hydrolase (TIGR01484 family)